MILLCESLIQCSEFIVQLHFNSSLHIYMIILMVFFFFLFFSLRNTRNASKFYFYRADMPSVSIWYVIILLQYWLYINLFLSTIYGM